MQIEKLKFRAINFHGYACDPQTQWSELLVEH